MFLSVSCQFMEASVSLIHAVQFQQCQSLIENLIRFCIIVVHGSSRFGRTDNRLFPAFYRFIILPQTFISATHEIIEIIFLCTVQLTFTQVMWIFKTLCQQRDSFTVIPGFKCFLRQFHTGKLILSRYFSFAAFPRMEDMRIK